MRRFGKVLPVLFVIAAFGFVTEAKAQCCGSAKGRVIHRISRPFARPQSTCCQRPVVTAAQNITHVAVGTVVNVAQALPQAVQQVRACNGTCPAQ